MSDDTPDGDRRRVVASALAEHGPALRAFVARRMPTPEVDDVLQTAATRAVERAATLADPTRVRAWLYRLHRNVVTDALRKRARRRKWIDPDAAVPEPSAPVALPTCACGLVQARSLSPPYAEILRLVDVGEHSIAEAASALGVSKNNATVRLHRARGKLRARMLAHCGVTRFEDCQDCRCAHDGCCVA